MSLEALYRRSPIWAQNLMLNAYALHIHRYRHGRRLGAALRRMREIQHWPPEAIRTYQDRRIRRIVETAFEGSPYYRRLMRETSVGPGDIKGAADLAALPLLTRDAVRKHADQLRTRRRPRRGWVHGHTSGTTGTPLSLWYDRATCVMNEAVDRRQKTWAGMPANAWLGLFLGRVVVPPRQTTPPFWRVNRVHRQVWFSCFHMSEENLSAYVNEIRLRRLRYLDGYPSTLFILANFIRRQGIECPMEAVFTSSETLHTVQRAVIAEAFQCEIFDFYGHAERVAFASECDVHSGKHLAEEYGYVEVVDESGDPLPDGETGYLVGTSLHNEAMPMIRYRTGDVSAIVTEPCECGRTLRRIRDVTTKAEDIVVTPAGRMISPSVLTHPFKPIEEIDKSQIIQESLDRVRIKIVPSGEFTTERRAELVGSLRERLGADMSIDVDLVPEIPPEPSGKFRWVVSHVQHENLFSWDEAGHE